MAGAALLILAGCGDGNGATLGGSLTGLTDGLSLVVQDNGANNLTLNANGGWAFPNEMSDGPYNVTILTEPSGQICTVTNGTGTFTSASGSVSNIVISCGTNLTISGTVTGLASGASVTLSTGSAVLPIAVNGTFSFPTALPEGTAYQVTVATQPVGQTCTIANAAGTLTAGVPTNIIVTCA